MTIQFFEPMKIPSITQQEHRIGVTKTGTKYIYEHQELKNARTLIRAHMALHKPEAPLEGPVELDVIWIYRSDDHEEGEFKTTKPDTDNLVKMLKDELTHCGFWKDDAQVCREQLTKIWSKKKEGIIVSVGNLPEVIFGVIQP